MSEDALTMRGPVHGTKDARKVAIGSGVGAVIETYDFIGFGTAAALYFGTAFFPGASPIRAACASTSAKEIERERNRYIPAS